MVNEKKLIDKEGILSDFINNRVISYEEPSRMGTPKGIQVGFSLVKYSSSLLMLTSLSLKEISENLAVSYGLLKKWRTEKTFERMIESHVNEFCPIFFNKIQEREDLLRKKIQEALNIPGKQILKAVEKLKCGPLIKTKDFQDYDNYGKDLVAGIIKFSHNRINLAFHINTERKSAQIYEEINFNSLNIFKPVSRIFELDFLNLFWHWKKQYPFIGDEEESKEYYQKIYQLIRSIGDFQSEALDSIINNYYKSGNKKIAEEAMKLIIIYYSLDRQFIQLRKPI